MRGILFLTPITGEGAYKIAGGENGGIIKFLNLLFFALYLNFRIMDTFAALVSKTGILGSIARLLVVPMFFLSLVNIARSCQIESRQVLVVLLTILTVTHLTVLLILSISFGPLSLLMFTLLNQYLLNRLLSLERRKYGCR